MQSTHQDPAEASRIGALEPETMLLLFLQFNHNKSYYALHAKDSAANGVVIWVYFVFVAFALYVGVKVYLDIKRERRK